MKLFLKENIVVDVLLGLFGLWSLFGMLLIIISMGVMAGKLAVYLWLLHGLVPVLRIFVFGVSIVIFSVWAMLFVVYKFWKIL